MALRSWLYRTRVRTWLPAAFLAGGAFLLAGVVPNACQPRRAALDPSLPAPAVRTQAFTPTLTASPTVTPTLTSTPTLTLTPSPSATPAQGEAWVIGSSAGGRPLEVYRFGEGTMVRMIVAGIHGGYESNTVALADELIAYLRENPGKVPEDKTLYILRNLNPDGLAREIGPDGRANQNGVDLNRNWDAGWAAEWDQAACWSLRPLTAGEYPHSEPETRALAYFILVHKPDALISYHSAALGIFPGGKPPGAASKSLARLLSNVSGYGYPPVGGACAYTGQLIDWASAQGAAALDVELTNHTDTDLAINLRVLSAFLNWMP